jgi:predicted RND superfamily exporter protein
MINFFQSIVKNSKLTLLVLGSFIAVGSLSLDKFRFDASSDTLVLDSDPSYELYEGINDKFSSTEFLVIALEDDNIFSEEGLKQLQLLENELEKIEGVSNVISILDAPLFEQPKLSLVKSATNDKYLLQDSLNLKSVKIELTESPLFNELIINSSGSAIAMQLNLTDLDDYSGTVLDIRNTLEKNTFFSHSYLAGPAMIVSDTISFIKKDVQNFGLITFLIFFILLSVFFKDFWSATIIMTNATFVIFLTICLLGFYDWPISIVSSNFLTLLFISSIAVSVHMLVKLHEGQKENIPYEHSLAKIFIPCFYAALTTMVGFLSLLLSNIQPVIDFGKMMALGVVINLLISFLFIPALIGIKRLNESNQLSIADIYYKYLYVDFVHIFRKIVMPLVLFSIPFFIYQASNLKVENKFIDYFNESTEIHRGMYFIDQQLGGTTPLDIILSLPEEETFIDEEDLFFSEGSETSDYWWRQKNMRILKDVQSNLDNLPEIGKALSIVNGVLLAEKINNFNEMGDLELAFVKNSLLTNDKAKDLLSSYITEDNKEVRISLRIIDTYDQLNRNELINSIDNYLLNKLNNTNIDYQISGLGVLYNNLLQSLFSSQIKTLSFVFIAIFLMLLVLFRSFFTALVVIFIPSIAVGMIFTTMSLLSIPLDIMTITIASISVGMSVDYAIHIAWRFKEEQKILSESAEKNTIYSSGQAVLITALTIVIGFLVFSFSNFNPTILFGLLSALSIYLSAELSLRLIPSILNTK